MSNFDTDRLVEVLQQQLRTREQLLVAIDGPGGSGKSTMATELRSVLGATVVEGDGFYRVMDESDRVLLEPEQGYRQYFDWERLRDELEPLRKGQKARYRQFDWSRGKLGTSVEVEPTGVILVDGVYSFRPELRAYYDFSICVEAPADQRLERLRSRGENSEGWIKRWTAAEDWYFAHVLSELDVDLVVSGSAP